MKKIINDAFFTIEKYNENSLSLISNHIYRVFDPISLKVLEKSHRFDYINKVLYNSKSKLKLIYNINGKLEIYREGEKIHVGKIGYDPLYNNCQINGNGFIYHNSERNKLYTFIDGKEELVSFDESLSFNSIAEISNNKFITTVSNYERGLTSFYMSVLKDNCLISNYLFDLQCTLYIGHVFRDEKTIAYSVSAPHTITTKRKYNFYNNILILDLKSFSHKLGLNEEYEDNEMGFDDFKISPDGTKIALINSQAFYIFSLLQNKYIFFENVEHGSCVWWIDNSKLLIGTWEGLFLCEL